MGPKRPDRPRHLADQRRYIERSAGQQLPKPLLPLLAVAVNSPTPGMVSNFLAVLSLFFQIVSFRSSSEIPCPRFLMRLICSRKALIAMAPAPLPPTAPVQLDAISVLLPALRRFRTFFRRPEGGGHAISLRLVRQIWNLSERTGKSLSGRWMADKIRKAVRKRASAQVAGTLSQDAGRLGAKGLFIQTGPAAGKSPGVRPCGG